MFLPRVVRSLAGRAWRDTSSSRAIPLSFQGRYISYNHIFPTLSSTSSTPSTPNSQSRYVSSTSASSQLSQEATQAPPAPPASSDLQSTDLLDVYQSLCARGVLVWDEEQVRCVMEVSGCFRISSQGIGEVDKVELGEVKDFVLGQWRKMQ